MDPEQNPMSRDPNPQIVESLQSDVGPKKTMGIVGPDPQDGDQRFYCQESNNAEGQSFSFP